MGRVYTTAFSGSAQTAQVDFFQLVAPSTSSVIVHEVGLSQLLDFGDAAEEMLLVLLKQGQTTTGSGGTTPTAVPRIFGDTAFGGTVMYMNTTKASAGTIVTHYAWNWNIRIPFQMIWTPETRPVLAPSRRMTIELATTPADSVTFAGYLVWESES